jgi:hypothetical protein
VARRCDATCPHHLPAPARDEPRESTPPPPTPSPAQLVVRTNTNFEIIGHPGGSTLDAQNISRVFDVDYRGALTLKNVTLINGLADDGGAIRLRSRYNTDVPLEASVPATEAARLAIFGGAIRDCEATNDGGAVAALAEAALFGSAAGIGPLVVPSSASARPLTLARLRCPSRDALSCPSPSQVSISTSIEPR